MNDLYADLAKRFDKHYPLSKGGVQLDYLTGEQVITRLNQTLGVDNWGFEVVEHGHADKDFWARGRLTVYFPERTVVREQFGGVRNHGMELADAMKSAATDALKKAATLIGVGLYLTDKDERASGEPAAPPPKAPPPKAPPVNILAERQAQIRQEIADHEGPTHEATYTTNVYPARQAHAPAPKGSRPAPSAGAIRAAPSALAGGVFRALTEDEQTVFYDRVKELTSYSVADVSVVLGGPVNDYLRRMHAAGTPRAGRQLILDLNAHKREGRAIPGVVSATVKALRDDAPDSIGCAVCGNELAPITFRDGTAWTPQRLAEVSTQAHGKPLCMTHHREFNAAKAGKSGHDQVMA